MSPTNASIRLTGNGCDGVLFEDSVSYIVDGGSIETTRYPIYIQMRERSIVDLEEGLVTSKHGPRLSTSDQWLAALRDDDPATTTLESNGWFAPARCLGEGTLQTLPDRVAERGSGRRCHRL